MNKQEQVNTLLVVAQALTNERNNTHAKDLTILISRIAGSGHNAGLKKRIEVALKPSAKKAIQVQVDEAETPISNIGRVWSGGVWIGGNTENHFKKKDLTWPQEILVQDDAVVADNTEPSEFEADNTEQSIDVVLDNTEFELPTIGIEAQQTETELFASEYKKYLNLSPPEMKAIAPNNDLRALANELGCVTVGNMNSATLSKRIQEAIANKIKE